MYEFGDNKLIVNDTTIFLSITTTVYMESICMLNSCISASVHIHYI